LQLVVGIAPGRVGALGDQIVLLNATLIPESFIFAHISLERVLSPTQHSSVLTEETPEYISS